MTPLQDPSIPAGCADAPARPTVLRHRRKATGCAAWTAAGLLAALASTAPASASPASTPLAAGAEALPNNATELHAALLAEVGQPTCHASSECRSVPVGHKACGGPEGWLASSTGVGRAERIDTLAAALAEARRAAQQASGLMSTCSVLADPGARCRAGVCELQAAPRGRAGGVVR